MCHSIKPFSITRETMFLHIVNKINCIFITIYNIHVLHKQNFGFEEDKSQLPHVHVSFDVPLPIVNATFSYIKFAIP